MFLHRVVKSIKSIDAFSWFSVLFFAACIGLSLFLWLEKKKPELSFIQGLQQCAQNTDGDAQLISCTRTLVSYDLRDHSAADLMAELATSSIPKRYFDCHGVAHIIGEATYDKYNDVEKAMNACPRGCYNGCMHGVLAGAVKAEYGASDPGADIAHMDIAQIEKIGAKYCTSAALCHGIGHVLYFLLNDFEKASEGCNAISKHFAYESCLEGVFMQGVGSLHESLALEEGELPPKAGPHDDYAYPCDSISPKSQRGCFLYLPRYQSITFDADKIADPQARLKISETVCSKLRGNARSYCFEGIGQYAYVYVPVPADIQNYAKSVATMCESFPSPSDRESCVLGFVHVSRAYDYNRQAYRFCTAVHTNELQTLCYFANFQLYNLQTELTTADFCQYSNAIDACTSALSKYQSQDKTLPDYRFGLYGEVQ